MIEKNEQTKNSTEGNDRIGSTIQIIQQTDFKSKHLGFTRTLLLAMFAAMIGTGGQYGYALGVMNAPSEVNNYVFFFFFINNKDSIYS
jgi:hypothetical protein